MTAFPVRELSEEVLWLTRMRRDYHVPRRLFAKLLNASELTLGRWERQECEPSPVYKRLIRELMYFFMNVKAGAEVERIERYW